MVTALISLVSLAIGLGLGFYGWTIYTMLQRLHEERKERQQAKETGVIRIVGQPVRNQPIDLSSDAGPVSRPSPAQVEEQRQIERDRVLRENHR
jgi:hypothetical protein